MLQLIQLGLSAGSVDNPY